MTALQVSHRPPTRTQNPRRARRAEVEAYGVQSLGVVTRAEALDRGISQAGLRRLVDEGVWQRVHPGVFVTHNGPLGWRSRAVAALRYCGAGCCLGFEAAAFASGIIAKPPELLDVWSPRNRTIAPPRSISVHRRIELEGTVVRGTLARTRKDHTVVDIIGRSRGPDAVISIMCAGVRAGVHSEAIRDLLLVRSNVRWRALALGMVNDVSAGVESALEWHFHHDVERAHRLPRSVLQHREHLAGKGVRADARYEKYRTRVELDGQLAHPGGRTEDDTWRDNEVGIAHHELTLRYRWLHAAGTPCRTANQLYRALAARGWAGTPRRCGPACTVLAAR